MDEKGQIKISLSKFFLIIAIIVIVVIGFVIFNLLNEKNPVENETGNLNEKVNSLEGTTNTENTNKENTNTENTENTNKENTNTENTNTENTNTETSTMEKFSYKDLKVDNLKYGMTEKQVVDIMGEPDKKYKYNGNQNINGESITYTYGDLGLSFYKHEGTMLLSTAGTNSSKYTFTKGLKVGDTKEKVISSFYREDDNENKLRDICSSRPPNPGKSFGKYLYGHAVDNSVSDAVKANGNVEYAFINYSGYNSNDSKSNYMIIYEYGEPPYYTSNYADVSGVNGSLVFDMNNEDIVTYIRWYFDPKNPD